MDLLMPKVDGIQLLASLKADPRTRNIPVLMLTASNEADLARKVLDLGARDFIRKPIDPSELVPRVRNTVAAKRAEDQLRLRAQWLEEQVRLRTAEIAETRLEVVHCLARAAEYRDTDTGKHIQRVGMYSGVIARQLNLDPAFVELIELASPLHDVGKIGVPDDILLKTGKLTDEEFTVMKRHAALGARVFDTMNESDRRIVRTHTEVGAKILGDAKFELLKLAKVIALTHHEKYDGTGYPLGLKGEDIPLPGRIVAVADVFDALSSRRPYKPPLPREECFRIMSEERARHFDPNVLDAFFASKTEIVRIQVEMADL
jgi:putative two-component system response regulator